MLLDLSLDARVQLFVDDWDLVCLQVDLFLHFFQCLVHEGKVNIETKDVFEDHLGLMEFEDRRKGCNLLLEVNVQRALGVHFKRIPVGGQADVLKVHFKQIIYMI